MDKSNDDFLLLPCQKEWLLDGYYDNDSEDVTYYCKYRNKAMKIYFDGMQFSEMAGYWERLLAAIKPHCLECMARGVAGCTDNNAPQL